MKKKLRDFCSARNPVSLPAMRRKGTPTLIEATYGLCLHILYIQCICIRVEYVWYICMYKYAGRLCCNVTVWTNLHPTSPRTANNLPTWKLITGRILQISTAACHLQNSSKLGCIRSFSLGKTSTNKNWLVVSTHLKKYYSNWIISPRIGVKIKPKYLKPPPS